VVNLYPDQHHDNKDATSSRVYVADDFGLDLLSFRLTLYLRTQQLSGGDISRGLRFDNATKGIIFKLSGCSNPSVFQALGPKKRNKILCALKNEVLTFRQIERLTGINVRDHY